VAPEGGAARVGDTDFRIADFIRLVNEDLAAGIGNLVTRTVTMVERYRASVVPESTETSLPADLASRFDRNLEDFDFRSAAAVVLEAITGCNRAIAEARPWELAAAEGSDASVRKVLDDVLGGLIRDERMLADLLEVLVPGLSRRAAAQLGDGDPRAGQAAPLFPQLSERAHPESPS
jgi:methionyl-tRNA synthetase